MASLLERFRSASSVFRDPGQLETGPTASYEPSYSRRGHYYGANTQTAVVTKIYNQIANDVASVSVRHVRLGQNGRYEDDIDSSLNQCLTFRPNIDQTPRAFFQDLAWTMIENGQAAVVPVDTTASIYNSQGFDTKSMRVGKVVKHYSRTIEIELYDDRAGRRRNVVVPKENVAVVQNPFYEVMNKPNSDIKRLVSKLDLIDKLDGEYASGRLDMIIKLPYTVRNEYKEAQAEKKRRSLENQMAKSQLGVGYIDAADEIIQLNRPVSNSLLEQVESLTKQVYGSLGLTEDIFNGNANAQALTNYYSRTINPILDEIALALSWGFLSQTARTQGQSVRWFRSPFAMIPMEKFPELAVQLSSNEIATSNEMRSELGWKPSSDPNAEQLRNPNINPTESSSEVQPEPSNEEQDEEDGFEEVPFRELNLSDL